MIQASHDVITTILNRRSCRAYTHEQLTLDILSTILTCGIHAPSAHNKQPWDIVYVQDQQLLQELSNSVISFLKKVTNRLPWLDQPNLHLFYNAPTVIFISGDKKERYSPIDCALAIQNMALAAKAMGIGSCIIGLSVDFFNSPEGNVYLQRLKIPSTHQVSLALTLGHPIDAQLPEIKRNNGKIRKY